MKSPSKLISPLTAVHHIILTDADTFNSCNAHVSLHIKLIFFLFPSSCVFLAQKFPLDEFSFCFSATRTHTHTQIPLTVERDEFNINRHNIDMCSCDHTKRLSAYEGSVEIWYRRVMWRTSLLRIICALVGWLKIVNLINTRKLGFWSPKKQLKHSFAT
jgi:hypothetical protein